MHHKISEVNDETRKLQPAQGERQAELEARATIKGGGESLRVRAPKTRATVYADDSRMMDQRSASAPKGRTRMNMARGMYGIFTKHVRPKAVMVTASAAIANRRISVPKFPVQKEMSSM